MSIDRNTNGESTQNRAPRYHTVRAPARTDGIGHALRRAFAPATADNGGSDEFRLMLQIIDQRSAAG